MTIGASIFLIAVGAIVKYAITADVQGVNLDVVGTILMVAGAIGLVLSLLWMVTRGRTRVVDDGVTRTYPEEPIDRRY